MADETAVGFGPRMGWFAVRAVAPLAVARALSLAHVRPAGWTEATEALYAEPTAGAPAWLVTPALDGWVLAASRAALEEDTAALARRVAALSRTFGEAQAFGTHHVIEHCHWLRARAGTLERGFAYLGERGEVLFDQGAPTPAEEARFVGQPPGEWMPNEGDVLALAAVWSVDPGTLEGRAGLGTPLLATARRPGLLGRIFG